MAQRVLIVVAMALFAYPAFAASFVQRPVPPVARKAEATHKNENDGNQVKVSANPPVTVNVSVGAAPSGSGEQQQRKTDIEPSKWIDPITLFTAALVLVGFFQWRAIKRGNDLARENLTKLQRAFVHRSGFRWLSHGDTNNPTGPVFWTFHFDWENSGASQAEQLRIFVGTYLSDKDMPEGFDLAPRSESPLPRWPLGPKGTVTIGEIKIGGNDLLAVRDGKKFLYFWGKADYRDVFNETPDHVTEFFFRVIDVRGDPTKGWNRDSNNVEIITENQPRHNNAN